MTPAYSLRAAMGKVKVTPEEPAALQGYDPDTNIADPSRDLLDHLYARILILDDGIARSVIVGFDCCLSNEETVKAADPGGKPGVYREFIHTFPPGTRASWGAAAGVAEENVSLNPTHTHTAPAHFSDNYTSRVTRKIHELTSELVPVSLQVSVGESHISAFRRPTLHANHSVTINRELTVLSVVKKDGNPLGYLVNFPVHPTGVRNPTSRISSDIVGLAMREIEAEMGEGFVSLFLQGFSGDVCPTYGDNGPIDDTYADVRTGASVFHSDIRKALAIHESIQPGAIQNLQRTVTLPARDGFYVDRLTVKLVCIAIGDLVIVSVSGEVFNDYIDKIKNVSPFRYTLLSGVANGYSGYMPTYQAFHDGLGGYEMNTTPYTDEVEHIFVKAVQDILLKLD